jgi:MFS family permease
MFWIRMSTEQAIEEQNEARGTGAGEKVWHAGTLTYRRGGLIALFFWLLSGDFFWQLRERAIAPAMPLLLRMFGASDFIVALLLSTMPAVLSIALSPIVSFRSDRFRSRWGRRIPFLLLSTPPAFVSMVGLAFSPVFGRRIDQALGAHSPGITVCVLACIAFFWLIFDVTLVVTSSMHAALVNDVVPKKVIGRFFGMFRVASLGAGMFFNEYLLGQMEKHYVAIFLVIGTAFLVSFSLMCLMVREGDYAPPPPAKKGRLSERIAGAFETYVRECFTNPYYRWFFLSFLLAYMAFEPINLFSLYFSQSVGMKTASYGHYSAIQLLCSLIQAPILGWVADKIHPLRLTLFALFMYAMSTGLAFFFVRDQQTFALAHVICGTCSGMWLTATAPMAQVLLPRMKFATFASVLAICQATARLLVGPIVGWLLDFMNAGKTASTRDYHFIYLWACVFVTLSLMVTLVVYRKFMEHGGPKHYVAPE